MIKKLWDSSGLRAVFLFNIKVIGILVDIIITTLSLYVRLSINYVSKLNLVAPADLGPLCCNTLSTLI